MRTFILYAALAVSAAAAPPNVLLIVADDLGYGDLACYGSKEIKTPHIDNLAAQGVRLTDAYAAAPVCSPTRAALMTGRYPQKTGFDWVIRYTEKDRGLDAKESVLAARLKDAGYDTALYGKWHLGYQEKFRPKAHGFDDFFGFLAADLDYHSHTDALGDPGLYDNNGPTTAKGYLTDLITARAEKFLLKGRTKPFFLSVMYNAPHWPFQTADAKPSTKESYGPATGTRADYIAMVEHMDAGIGKLLDALNKKNLTKDTLVIVVSDNGGERLSDNGPLFHGKYTLWEGGVRVPCIVRWPRAATPEKASAVPIITMDLTASILTAAGAEAKDLDGVNMLPALFGTETAPERTFYWRLPRPNAQHGQTAVRRGDWKYLAERDSELLFDLKTDIGERKNLAYQHPAKLAELRTALAEWQKTLPQP